MSILKFLPVTVVSQLDLKLSLSLESYKKTTLHRPAISDNMFPRPKQFERVPRENGCDWVKEIA
ncbi:hypothetical protein T11_17358 [Trichinella zimbabwensis]|uniref:Uncharacterized protein n=1 Tax=Trichinella zimbabwensis TaxID=268475 RepID=A0A0V1H232_9BILA|nr:hypothetical protein T11_17358 [Trichinella zimbabwensis]